MSSWNFVLSWVEHENIFRLKDASIYEMVGAWCFGCCQAHWSLPVGFILLQYSVLCPVGSLSLLCLLFISCFKCFFGWCIDTLGVFYAKPNIYVSQSTSELRVGCAPWNRFGPQVKYFMTVPRQFFVCGSFVLFLSCVCHALLSVHCCLVVTCWERAGLLALVCRV